MSGIAGIIHFDGRPVEPGQVEAMTAAMHYRGPDGINHWRRGNVALGQCMLRTTPESLEEIQPLTNEDESLVLVMDGRVDNWEELRRELLGKGAVLRTRADAELVLRAYEVWGRDCLPHIDGDFALVIWGTRCRTAFCARDRMGNKPFNYHWDGKTLVFSSELHPIMALPWVVQVPNEGMFAEFLAAEWYSCEETLWQGVMRLGAAHCMDVGNVGPHPEPYWTPDLWATLPYKSDQEYIDRYRELLFDSVRRLSRSDRALAIEVSGGLDSSAVLCIAEHLRVTDQLPAPGVNAYTLGFTGDGEANELAYARAVGEFLGVDINEIPPSNPPLTWYATRANTDREFSGFPNGSMFLGIREQAATKGSRVTLTGEGGDEWLEGSRAYYAEEMARGNLFVLAECFRRDASLFGIRQSANWVFRHGFFELLPLQLQRVARRIVRTIHPRSTRDTGYWLSPRMQEVIKLRRRQYRPVGKLKIRSIGQREMLNTLYDALSAQVMDRAERDGARVGVELRYPLRNHHIVQFAFSTPERLRHRGEWSKWIHREALRGYMPSLILERKSKAEFSSMFRANLDQMEVEFTRTLPRKHGNWIDRDGMEKLFKVYQDSPELGWPTWTLWAIYACNNLLP